MDHSMIPSKETLKKQFGLQYHVRKGMLNPRLRKAFTQLDLDAGSMGFIRYSMTAPYSALWCWIRGSLSRYVSRYSADGILNMSRMHVLSSDHWRDLLKQPLDEKLGSLLDVGAGDGFVTETARPLFTNITATESSFALSWRLWMRGFTTVRTGDLKTSSLCNSGFDVVSCFNVLDRVDRPIDLLHSLKACAKEDTGRIVLAVVMPFCPAVMGPGGSRPPAQRLPVPGCCDGSKNNSWEECVNALVERVLWPEGFEVEAFARVPYLSHGDNRRKLYSLDDVVLVLKPNQVVSEDHKKDSANFCQQCE